MSDWISVEDRLPDFETDTLLVCVRCKHGDDYFSDTDGFQEGEFAYWSRQSNCSVTHWMPLPAPPVTK